MVSTEQAYKEIFDYMISVGGVFSDWYVGVTSDVRQRLFVDHRVQEETDAWVHKPCADDASARKVEANFLRLGCDGAGGGGSETVPSSMCIGRLLPRSPSYPRLAREIKMARSYQYHRVESFPVHATKGATLKTRTQFGLPVHGDDTAHSEIRFTGESDFPEFLKYFVRHEVSEKRKVRFQQEDRNEVIFVEEFHLFLPPNQKCSSPYLHQVRKGPAAEVAAAKPSFVYTIRDVDLLGFRNKLQAQIRGGWFRTSRSQMFQPPVYLVPPSARAMSGTARG